MADLWTPGCGVNIKQLADKLILCQFRHEVDLRRVLAEGPWHFDMNLLILEEIKPCQTPQDVSLLTADFWIQLSHVPEHFYSAAVGKSVGNTLGQYISYDEENVYSEPDAMMRIRVCVDVMEPLKIESKLRKTGYATATCPLAYEKLPNFCCIWGRLGHTDRICDVLFQVPITEIVRVWSDAIRAPTRRRRRLQTSPYPCNQGSMSKQNPKWVSRV
ncbi:hypothetical protein LINGRAPRIM_LOCUS2107 [Linum grandiflorum]